MKKNHLLKTEEIINSIDGIRHAPAPDFFYTRVKARMEKEIPVMNFRNRKLLPALLISGLVALLLINALIFFKDDESGIMSTGKNETMQIVVNEYHFNDVLAEELNQ